MKKLLLLLTLLLVWENTFAQEELIYQTPPKEILELADFERAPAVLMNNDHSLMVFQYRSTYKTLAELSEDEIKLAGLRIDPKTNMPAAIVYINNLKYKRLHEPEARQVEGLPADPLLTNFTWSPDQTRLAFTHTTDRGAELWVADFTTGEARRLTGPVLNGNLGFPFVWFGNGKSLLVKYLPADRPALTDTEKAIPAGPTVSVSESGVRAQNRTYQDLLRNKSDEDNFDILATSELYKVDLDGTASRWKNAGIYARLAFSPDGNYILTTTLHKPYSYIVTYGRFPARTDVYDTAGNPIKTIDERPLTEAMPQGFMAVLTGKRQIAWRNDKPATLYWAEALDGGDPARETAFRDEVFEWAAPFTGAPRSLVKTIDRFLGITWGNDQTAILQDHWWNTRNRRTYVFSPSDPSKTPVVLFDRNYQDIYSDPGRFETRYNGYGREVLSLDAHKAYLTGSGYGPQGKFPFVDEIDLRTKNTRRLYQSAYTDQLLDIIALKDSKTGELLVRLQSPTEYPNYYLLNIRRRIAPVAVTHFENPFKALEGVYKEVIRYQRSDGVELTGTLYLPVGYDRQNGGKLPMIMWAYPTEYKDKDSAGQSTASPNQFTYPSYGTPVYWVMRGYVVLDNAAFPIVGEGDEQPNDTFIDQLVDNARAAIDAVDALGYIDRNRVAVGGHSYGAFMTANLLTHSDLFAAGIARSGAYNRTLTPFGFQSEERNYWEVPEVYNAMSPFMHADKMKTPLLLIHGGNDNNAGTYTLQSERYFNALKGFGAPARLVILPKESHGYAARESIFHMLWEQDQWLEKYVKNRK